MSGSLSDTQKKLLQDALSAAQKGQDVPSFERDGLTIAVSKSGQRNFVKVHCKADLAKAVCDFGKKTLNCTVQGPFGTFTKEIVYVP